MENNKQQFYFVFCIAAITSIAINNLFASHAHTQLIVIVMHQIDVIPLILADDS